MFQIFYHNLKILQENVFASTFVNYNYKHIYIIYKLINDIIINYKYIIINYKYIMINYK
jgi:hypothetical protein